SAALRSRQVRMCLASRSVRLRSKRSTSRSSSATWPTTTRPRSTVGPTTQTDKSYGRAREDELVDRPPRAARDFARSQPGYSLAGAAVLDGRPDGHDCPDFGARSGKRWDHGHLRGPRPVTRVGSAAP